MSREVLAYLIMLLLGGCGAAVVVYSRRFYCSQRAYRRGNYAQKPVWRPFWLP